MSTIKMLLIVIAIALFVVGCQSASKSDPTAKTDTTKPADVNKIDVTKPVTTDKPIVSEPVKPNVITPDVPAVAHHVTPDNLTTEAGQVLTAEFKQQIFELIRDRKFFEAYQALAKIQPANDWVIAHTIFVGYALKKLEQNTGDTALQAEAIRAKAKDCMAKQQYHEAIELLFSIEPKSDQDLADMMDASHNLFKTSGGQEITRTLATVMIGFVHARSQKNEALEAKANEALTKIEATEVVDKEKYKQALVKATAFFKDLGQSFEELLVRHLEKSGYSLLEIQDATADKRSMLETKAEEGDKYSQLYLTWYDHYSAFNQIVNKLLLELSLK